jgi:hypothetical protein
MWTAIVLIVIAAVCGEAYRLHIKSRKAGVNPDDLKALNDKLDALDQDLRHRVETLERIVTDRKEDLKRQFDHLDKTG